MMRSHNKLGSEESLRPRGMNILMVNPVHPSTPHISAMRAWRFSQELARRGHRVVLLTAGGAGPSDSIRVFEHHDWRLPLVVTLPSTAPVEARTTGGGVMGKALTAAQMLRHGGRSGKWVSRAVDAVVRSSGSFRPDVVWCTFGMLESVFVAKRVASALHCPWVLDVKDNWELYVPRGIRRLMAWRIAGFAEATANARLTADLTWKWLGRRAAVVYSGVEAEFRPSPGDAQGQSKFVLNLIGSTYSPVRLDEFMEGVRAWLEAIPEADRSSVVLRYLGGDTERVLKAAVRLGLAERLDVAGYQPVVELARSCKSAAVNAYIALAATFHHKLLELLATGRPVLAFPSEHRESLDLAAATGGQLLVADDAAAVARNLAAVHAAWRMSPGATMQEFGPSLYSWPDQATELERILAQAITHGSEHK